MNNMNKSGQMSLLSFFISIGVFLLIWGIWLGKFLSEWCNNYIVNEGITGFTAFLLSYINLWIFLMLLIVVSFAYMFTGGNQ